jgi:hypothetical protein
MSVSAVAECYKFLNLYYERQDYFGLLSGYLFFLYTSLGVVKTMGYVGYDTASNTV